MIQGLAYGIAVVVVCSAVAILGWLVGGGGSKDAGSGTKVIRYGRMFRGLGMLAAVVIPLIIGIVLFVTLLTGATQPRSAPIALGLVGFFMLLGLPLVLEGFRKQVTLDDHGITSQGWFGGSTHIPWSKIEELSNRVARGFFLVLGDGKKIKVGHYMDGLDWLAEESRKRLEPRTYGDAFDKPINRPFL